MSKQIWLYIATFSSIALAYCMVLSDIVRTGRTLTKAELGHRLFFDQRLSATGARSCSSCHDPAFAFSDGYRKSVGVYGDRVLRNAPSLINVADRVAFTWADSTLISLEQQMLKPMFSTAPPELGIAGHEALVLGRLMEDEVYVRGFQQLFPQQKDPLNFDNIRQCIAAYQQGLIARASPYDDFISGKDKKRMSEPARRGMQLFNSQRLGCSHCHGGRDLDRPVSGSCYANTGLYFCPDIYPESDRGLYNLSRDTSDMGRFRIPSLRNIALTAPYFHDGSAVTLREVIEIYGRGGRANAGDVCAGDGSLSPYRDARLRRFELTEAEKSDLLHFLYALTDTSYNQNPYFKDPFLYE